VHVLVVQAEEEMLDHVRWSLEAMDAGDEARALRELDAIEERWRWLPYREPAPAGVRIGRYLRERIRRR
jgi:hypothetical protein